VLTSVRMNKTVLHKSDGRRIVYFDFVPEGTPAPVRTQADSIPGEPLAKGPEMRWNPLLGEWTIVAGYRMDRPQLPPQEKCPLCPGGAEIPEPFEIVTFDNRFPAFWRETGMPDTEGSPLCPVAPARGACEVLVYTQEHGGSFAELPVETIYRLVHVWADRTRDLHAIPEVQCAFPFENKGEIIGVTLHHPHGQVYAFPFVPPRIASELENARQAELRGGCLFCDILRLEQSDGRRIVAETEHFLAVVPFFARLPFEVHLYGKRHGCSWLPDLTSAESTDLACMLKLIAARYDALYAFSFPYMMVMHQLPPALCESYHFHVEFYPPHRSRDKLKYLASVESGAGSFLMDAYPERTAAELRALMPQTVPAPALEIV